MRSKNIAIYVIIILIIVISAIAIKYVLFIDAGSNYITCGFVKTHSSVLGNVEEGEWFSPNAFQMTLQKTSLLKYDNFCAPGLLAKSKVLVDEGLNGFYCGIPDCMCSSYICVRCGDGNCGNGENKCNCPEDCK